MHCFKVQDLSVGVTNMHTTTYKSSERQYICEELDWLFVIQDPAVYCASIHSLNVRYELIGLIVCTYICELWLVLNEWVFLAFSGLWRYFLQLWHFYLFLLLWNFHKWPAGVICCCQGIASVPLSDYRCKYDSAHQRRRLSHYIDLCMVIGKRMATCPAAPHNGLQEEVKLF